MNRERMADVVARQFLTGLISDGPRHTIQTEAHASVYTVGRGRHKVLVKEAEIPEPGIRMRRDVAANLLNQFAVQSKLQEEGVSASAYPYGVGSSRNLQYYMEEYVEGETISNLPKEKVAAQFGKLVQMSRESLRSIHEAEVLWGDIHARNLRLREDGSQIVFLDAEFGVDVDTISNTNNKLAELRALYGDNFARNPDNFYRTYLSWTEIHDLSVESARLIEHKLTTMALLSQVAGQMDNWPAVTDLLTEAQILQRKEALYAQPKIGGLLDAFFEIDMRVFCLDLIVEEILKQNGVRVDETTLTYLKGILSPFNEDKAAALANS